MTAEPDAIACGIRIGIFLFDCSFLLCLLQIVS
jgi:hypothetical protein